MNEATEADVRAYIDGLIVPEAQDRYINRTFIPMLGDRTWKELFDADDRAAMAAGLSYLRDMFGD